jgi:peptidoglycan/LPS O-acetylase OafA/YrhL
VSTATRDRPGTTTVPDAAQAWIVPATDGYRPSLDGLRAIAVVTVMVFHFTPDALPGGFVGVDVFYVLSGYLITRLLADELDRTGRVAFAAFSARRVRRLLPAALLVIAAVTVATMVLGNSLDRALVADDVLPAALAWTNWHELAGATDYFAPTRELAPFGHFWSLAVEEQFYLVWPASVAVLWVLARSLGRPGRRVGLVVTTVGAVAGLLWWVRTGATDPVAAYYATWFRAAQLAAGAALALADPRRLSDRVTARWPTAALPAAGALTAAGVVAILLVAVAFPAGSSYPGGWGPAVTLATVVAVVGVEWSPGGAVSRLLALRPLVAVGLVSYSLYLWHIPVEEFAPLVAERWDLAWVTGFVPKVLATVALAVLSYRLVESPVRHSTRLRRAPAGAVVLLFLLVFLAGALLATLALRAPGSVAVPDLSPAELRAAAEDSPDTYATGCHGGQANGWTGGVCVRHPDVPGRPTVAIVGDSHAANWDSALARLAGDEDLGYRYATYSACPPVDVEFDERSQADGCERFRAAVLPELATLGADDAVVLAFSWTSLTEELAAAVPADRDELVAEVASGFADTAEAVDDGGAQVVVLGPIPILPRGAPNCLADAEEVTDCVVELGAARSAEEELAAEVLGPLVASGAVDAVVPIDGLVCPARTCSALEGDVITYRDREHITRDFSASLADELGDLLHDAGAL